MCSSVLQVMWELPRSMYALTSRKLIFSLSSINSSKKISGIVKKFPVITFLFSGLALNFGILAIISSSSSAELFTLVVRTL